MQEVIILRKINLMKNILLAMTCLLLLAGCTTSIEKKMKPVVKPYVQNVLGNESTIKEVTVIKVDTITPYHKLVYLQGELEIGLQKMNMIMMAFQSLISAKTAEYNKAATTKEKAAIKQVIDEKVKERENLIETGIKPIAEELSKLQGNIAGADKKIFLAYIAKADVLYRKNGVEKRDTINVIVTKKFKPLSVKEFLKS